MPVEKINTVHSDILIIGAGPGGLACARVLAEHGRQVLVLERKQTIGAKVCAGGITWDGLINVVPESLIERAFCRQYVYSSRQKVLVAEKNPIIATINRKKLGQWMAQKALDSGAKILTGSRVTAIKGHTVLVRSSSGKRRTEITCQHLIGADGALSQVRKSLGIPVKLLGPGINYQLAAQAERMEWHLNTKHFGYGYGWIFPHRATVSIGAYCPCGTMSGKRLKQNLISWAAGKGYCLEKEKCQAAMINYDYQGYAFGTTWLVGDAAGLASGLTGEGIYPAIVSGDTVARKIIDPENSDRAITEMVNKQRQHHTVISLAKKHPALCSLLMETLIFMLKCKIINFHSLEMAAPKKK